MVYIRYPVRISYDLSLKGVPPFSSGMMSDPVHHFPGEIEPLEIPLKMLDDSNSLFKMSETIRIQYCKCPFARMAERSVSEIVSHSDSLGQILIELQRS